MQRTSRFPLHTLIYSKITTKPLSLSLSLIIFMASSSSSSSSSSLSKAYLRIHHGFRALFTPDRTLFLFLFLILLYFTKVFISSSETSKISLVITTIFPKNNATDLTVIPNPNAQTDGSDELFEMGAQNFNFSKNQEQGMMEVEAEEEESCDLFEGRWVEDDGSGPSYEPGSCPLIDDGFNCVKAGRLDLNYTGWRWQPKGCELPR